MKVLLAGATGLVGSELSRLLDLDPSIELTILSRSRVPGLSPRSRTVIANLGPDWLSGVQKDRFDAVVSCLGTTIKKAGSRDAFRQVDFDAPLNLARFAKETGAGQYLSVSSLGADAGSSMFYSRVKGELENVVQALQLPSTVFFRPSLLLGERKEFRLGERIAEGVLPLLNLFLVGPFQRYRGTEVEVLARFMLQILLDPKPGFRIVENEEIQ